MARGVVRPGVLDVQGRGQHGAPGRVPVLSGPRVGSDSASPTGPFLMPAIRCFWLEETDRVRRGLRRYRSTDESATWCPGALKYHNAENPFDVVVAGFDERDGRRLSHALSSIEGELETDDWRWPKHCDACDYAFTDDDPRQVNVELIYRRSHTRDLVTRGQAP